MNKMSALLKALNMPEGNPCKAEQKRLAPSSSIKVGGRGGDLFTVPLGNRRRAACIPILCKALIAYLGITLLKAINSIFYLVAGDRS